MNRAVVNEATDSVDIDYVSALLIGWTLLCPLRILCKLSITLVTFSIIVFRVVSLRQLLISSVSGFKSGNADIHY